MGASHTSVIYDGIAISDAQNGQVDISRFDLEDKFDSQGLNPLKVYYSYFKNEASPSVESDAFYFQS